MTPEPQRLSGLLAAAGGDVDTVDDALVVRGIDNVQVGTIAGANHITLYELSTYSASLEDAFFELTHDAADYRAGEWRVIELEGAVA